MKYNKMFIKAMTVGIPRDLGRL